MTRVLWPLFILSLVIIAPGCGNSDEIESQQRAELAQTTPAQRAHAACVSSGNKTELRHLPDKATPVLMCIFADGSECLALQLLNGTCVPTLPAETDPVKKGEPLSELPRFCDPIVEAVCGRDGKTYINECVAKQQGVEIDHAGSCSPTVAPTQISASPDTVVIPPPQAPVSPTPRSPSALPEWLDVPISLLSENTNAVRPFIQECTINATRYYLQAEDCAQCLSVLYDQSGQVVCYPSHDLGNLCPTGIVNRSCRTVWQK